MAIDKILMGSKLKRCRGNLQRTIMEIDGLKELETRTYKTEDGSSHGRLYTLRGDVENPDAVVYQLVSFNGGEMINLLYQDDKLLLLNDKFEKPKEATTSNVYSITAVEK